MQKKISIIIGILIVLFVAGALIMMQRQEVQAPEQEQSDDIVITEEGMSAIDFASYIANDEDNVTVIYNLSEEKKQEIRDGIVLWQEQQDGGSIEPYLQEATLQSSLGNHEEALVVLDRAAEIYPTNVTLHLNQAEINRRTGKYLDAAYLYATAIDLNDDNPNSYLGLGDLIVKFAFDKSIAELIFETGLAKTDEHIDLLTAYADYLDEEKDDKVAALEYWRKAYEKSEVKSIKESIGEEIEKLEQDL
ncbi:MAG: hypothetical protein ACPGO5_03350 [Patescibacteria group bacterium]